LRKIAATALAIPIVAAILLSSILAGLMKRSGSPKALLMLGGIGVLVCGLLVSLPVKSVSGQQLPTFAALAPQGDLALSDEDLALDAPFVIKFTKPMNETSVEGNITLVPETRVLFKWNATGQTLSLLPDPHWQHDTQYQVRVSADATDQEGLNLASPIDATFAAGSPTTATIQATEVVDGLASPLTAFQISFTRAVKVSTVMAKVTISPSVDLTIEGEDPTDLASQVFTVTPKEQLAPNTQYIVTVWGGGQDSSGSDLADIEPFAITTMETPGIVRFRPADGTVSYDTRQPISVRFTVPMDKKATAAALSVTVNGKKVTGNSYWAESDTVLVLTPRTALPINAVVVATVSTAARSTGGIHISAASKSTFTVKRPTSSGISYGGRATSSSPWYASEVYYLKLMNCTRTGNWVTRSGDCSTETHHTLPAQSPVALDAGISNKVARPYAQYMAENRLLDHFLRGTNPHTRLCRAGYCGPSWGENIASPWSYGPSGMIAVEIFYQNESPCRCEHYAGIMNPHFRRAGIGVWYVKGKGVRVAIDFYA
jgi:uncharacterized protein YkwD